MPLQDVDGVEAPLRATLAGEHGPAEPVVVVEGGRAEWVGGADPLGRGTGDDRVRLGCVRDLGLAGGHALLAPLATGVAAAVALERKERKNVK